MDEPIQTCKHCGADVSPQATVCGSCQRSLGFSWLWVSLIWGLIISAVLFGGMIVLVSLRQSIKDQSAQPAPSPAAAPAAAPVHRSTAAAAAPPPPPAGMVLVPGGPFPMGSAAEDALPDQQPQHEVLLDAFYLDTREVTVEDYRAFCLKTGCRFPDPQPEWSTPRHPVVFVNWADADSYCRHLGWRLPTEAQWERAALDISPEYFERKLPHASLHILSWHQENSDTQSHPVGSKAHNSLGIYDLLGNVSEWVSDWYSPAYYGSSPRQEPAGPAQGEEKVVRGGAFDTPIEHIDLRARERFGPGSSEWNRGFRCARTAEPTRP